MQKRWIALLIAGAIVMSGATAWAGDPPSTAFSLGEQQDALLGLEVLDRILEGDARNACTVEIFVVDFLEPFTEGDTINIQVREDDGFLNQTLWQIDFEVTPEEVEEGLVDRTFDCAAAFGEDFFGDLDIYAQAEVVKQDCGFGCRYDRPRTANISVAVDSDDDRFEDNDTLEAAAPLGQDTVEDMISRDPDWFEVTVAGPSDLSVYVLEYESNRNLDVKLFDDEGELALDVSAVAETSDLGTILERQRVEAGTYFLRIAPLVADDLGYYLMQVQVEDPEGACEPDATESRACGMCGTQERTCGADGDWGEFGACSDEGVCTPGAEQTSSCGMCGQTTITCDDQCQWGEPGECSDQGECERGTTEAQECGEGLSQVRTCDDTCTWTEFGECRGDECEDGELQVCYDGPEGTAGVGICREGRQQCENGVWLPCEGQIMPSEEVCDDGADNDCDGAEEACPDPEPEPEPGCARDADCPANMPVCDPDSGECEAAPVLGCTSDADCGGATPVCNVGTGDCEAAAEPGNNDTNNGGNNAGNNDTNNGGNNSAGNNDTNNSAGNNDTNNGGNNGDLTTDQPAASNGSKDSGCAVAPGQSVDHAWWALLALGALWLRRRG
jgi:MYXO-CTERM domain-containing protein